MLLLLYVKGERQRRGLEARANAWTHLAPSSAPVSLPWTDEMYQDILTHGYEALLLHDPDAKHMSLLVTLLLDLVYQWLDERSSQGRELSRQEMQRKVIPHVKPVLLRAMLHHPLHLSIWTRLFTTVSIHGQECALFSAKELREFLSIATSKGVLFRMDYSDA